MSLTCLISNTSVQVESFGRPDRIDEHTVLTIVIRDDAGMASYSKGMPISLFDSILGGLFTGYVGQAHMENLYPNATNLWTLVCIQAGDYLASKRTSKRAIYNNQYSGTIAVDQVVNGNGAQESLLARAALRWDELLPVWQAGTLTNTVATTNATDGNVGDGDLELALAGSQVSVTGAGAGFGLGAGLKLTGYCSSGYSNAYCYRQIWSGSQAISNGHGDFVIYSMRISSDSPEIKAGLDFVCSDGTSLRDSVSLDLQGLDSHPNTDLSSLARDVWYRRTVFCSAALNNKTINTFSVAFEGDNQGQYTAYFKDITFHHWNGSSYDAITIFSSSLQSNVQLQNNGYTNVSLDLVQVEDDSSSTMHSALSISSAGIVKSSTMTYTSLIPDGCTGKRETSIDGGASWQLHAASGDPVANLLPGMSVSGRSVLYRDTLTIGKDPTVAIGLGGPTLTVESAYNATKNDTIASYTTSSDFASGTLIDVKSAGTNGITTNGYQRNWDDASYASQTLYGTPSPTQAVVNKQLKTSVGANGVVHSRLDFAGQWADFTSECDIQVSNTLNARYTYRTTAWANVDNFAYGIEITTTAVKLYKGTNTTSTGSYTQLGSTFTLNLVNNSIHRVKFVISGNSHKVYVDGIKAIDTTDGTFTAAGYLALGLSNPTASTQSMLFDNFGVCSALSGTWQSSSIDISGPGTYGNSVFQWDTDGIPDSTCTVSAQTSIDGGTSWQSVTNGGAISGLTAGGSLAGKHLLIKMTLDASNADKVQVLNGLTVWIMGRYSASGTRVSPSLPLARVPRAGTALVNWNANVPANTSLVVQTSINGGSTWQTVSTPGGAISGISTQPTPTEDTFSSDTSASYTQGNWGGSNAALTWDTANSRLIATGGILAVLAYNTALTAADNQVFGDFDQADGSGLLTNYTATTSGYYIRIYDSLATGGTPNTCKLFRRSGGTSAQVGSTATISFTRGSIKRFVLDVEAGVITVLLDGVSIISYTDGSPLGAGSSGFVLNTLARVYSLYIQQYGQDVSGLSLLTKLTLTSTDPTKTPQVLDMQAMVSSPDIGPGVLVTNVNYKGKYLGDVFKDLSIRSNYWCYFGFANSSSAYGHSAYGAGPYGGSSTTLFFQARNAFSSPFVMADVNSQTIAGQQIYDILLDSAGLDNLADSYRNRINMRNAMATGTYTEVKKGDGSTRTWNVARPLSAPPTSITLNGKVQTFGIKNVDSGKNFYYQLGSTAIDQDGSGTLLQATDSFTIVYTGTSTQDVIRDNTSFPGTITQSMMAAIENTAGGSSTGIWEAEYDASLLTVAQAQDLGDQLNQRYGVIGSTFTFKTLRSGLVPGMQVPMFVSAYNQHDIQNLITQVDVVPNLSPAVNGGILYMWKVTVQTGSNLGTWTQLFKNMIGG